MLAATAALAAALPLLLVPPASAGEETPGLRGAFASAAREYGVPESVLLGVSYLQSRWDGHHGAASVSGGYGPMHLTDAATALAGAGHHAEGAEDPRGDDARPALRPAAHAPESPQGPEDRGPQTLPRAAGLTGLPAGELRTSPAANVRGGAALLAEAQRGLGRPLSADPADWYAAVAAYPGAGTRQAAESFADEVYATINAGASRVTDTGERLALPPTQARPDAADRAAVAALGLPAPARDPRAECPRALSCAWLPAPYEELGEGEYGNHDQAERPDAPAIETIVIHDTEATWETTLDLVQDPAYVSWHYSLRSSDGHVAQHLSTEDVGWHAGNWYVNATSIGLEHEGFLTAPDAWYTEAMYRASARLVRYLAARFDIPLDRHHILGHDNVQGPLPASVPGMHTDPGPYWDWSHYFDLLGAPFVPTAGPGAGVVTIAPDYATHQPEFTGCGEPGAPCPPHGSGAVRLHAAPAPDAPLIRDPGTHPGDGASGPGVNDVGARASAGQQFAVAGRQGDWTAIWYLGQRAWFHNPPEAPTALNARARVITARPGLDALPVYGRAYPEAAAYPPGVPAQAVTPLPYTIPAGQAYVAGALTDSSYFRAVTFDPSQHQLVRGEPYYQIQLGHRVAYVRAADVLARRA